jgi:apoptosis-inducing factor 3
MELVVAVSKRNLASIDVIGMESYPFEAVLGKEVGAALKKVCALSMTSASFKTPSIDSLVQFHESKGVRFHMNSSVSKLLPSSSDPSSVGTVVVKSSSGRCSHYGSWCSTRHRIFEVQQRL